MPALALVVCVYRQRDLLERLLQKAAGCYDDLVVVHDGPDTDGVKALVEKFGGRFFEHPRVGSLEGQSPFAWAQAKHDWILRLDADEFPSEEMIGWLKQFRTAATPAENTSGYTCIWPVWNGLRAVTSNWPRGRIFLFDRQRVRFFGMIEQVPLADGQYQPVNMILHHQPKRRSLGLRNVLLRKQAYQWRRVIAMALLGKPTDLPCWRWESQAWPGDWEQIRQRPLRTALSRLVMGTFRALRDQWRNERKLFPLAAVNGPIHHVLICFEYWRQHRQHPSN